LGFFFSPFFYSLEKRFLEMDCAVDYPSAIRFDRRPFLCRFFLDKIPCPLRGGTLAFLLLQFFDSLPLPTFASLKVRRGDEQRTPFALPFFNTGFVSVIGANSFFFLRFHFPRQAGCFFMLFLLVAGDVLFFARRMLFTAGWSPLRFGPFSASCTSRTVHKRSFSICSHPMASFYCMARHTPPL